MYYNLIKNFVNKLTKEDIITFSKKKEIILTKIELDFIYDNIKNNWVDIYNGDTHKLFDSAKKVLKENTYNKAIELYEEKRKLL